MRGWRDGDGQRLISVDGQAHCSRSVAEPAQMLAPREPLISLVGCRPGEARRAESSARKPARWPPSTRRPRLFAFS